MKNKKEKFHLEHPLIYQVVKYLIVILVIYLLISLFLSFYNKLEISFKSSPELIAVFASLLGASVGGIITYFTTTHSILKTNHVKSSIINKKTIYEPVLKDLNDILQEFDKEKEIEGLYRQYKWHGSKSLGAWERIKKDTRIYQIPDYAKEEVYKMEQILTEYFVHIDNIQDEAFKHFEKLLEDNGYRIKENHGGLASILLNVEKLLGKKQDLVLDLFKERVFGLPEVSQTDIKIINENYNKYISENINVEIYQEKMKKATNSLRSCKKLIELMIVTIINKYEKQNKII